MFFKRNAKLGQTALICNHDGQCEVNINNRRLCASCRLVKCFKSGMSIDMFRASIQKRMKTNGPTNTTTSPIMNTLVRVEKQHQPERFSTLNLLQSDTSLLTTSQWTLLSNLIHGYNESNLLLIGQHLTNVSNALQSTKVIYQTLMEEYMATIYTTTGIYLRSNDDLCKLSSNDRSILLRSAADSVACLGFEFVSHQSHLFACETFLNVIETMYGKHPVTLHLWAMKFIDQDFVLIKLGISLFAVTKCTCLFSTDVSTEFSNASAILEIQNKYAEVTWKYLLYKYGHDQAVKRFLNLIQWLVAMSVFMFHVQSITLHVNDVDSLVQQTEVTLMLDDVDQMIETNKQLSVSNL